MKNLENEYNKRFKNQKMDLSDFDVDGLWDSISEELDQTTPPKSPNKNYWNLLGVTTLLIAIAFGIYQFRLSDTTITANIPKTQHTKKLSEKPAQSTKNTEKQPITQIIAKPNQLSDNSTQELIKPTNSSAQSQKTTTSLTKKNLTAALMEHQESPSSMEPIQTKRTSTVSESKTIATNTPLSKDRQLSQKQTNQQDGQGVKALTTTHSASETTLRNNNDSENTLESNITNMPSSKDNPIAQNSSIQQEGQDIKDAAITNNFTEVKHLQNNDSNKTLEKPNSKTPENAQLDNEETASIANKLEDSSAPEIAKDSASLASSIPKIDLPKIKKIHWETSAFAGINKTKWSFQPSQVEGLSSIKNNSIHGSWGNSFGADITLIWKNKWTASSGISYQNLWSKLDYTKQTIQNKIRDSILTTVFINQQGEIISTVYDTIEISDTTNVRTVWNNHFQTIRIPLEIGFQKNIKHWRLGAKLGASFNFNIAQSGKTFGDDLNVLTYNSKNQEVPLHSFHIGFKATPYIGYHLKRSFVTISPTWNWYRGQSALVQDFGIQIGAGLRLK